MFHPQPVADNDGNNSENVNVNGFRLRPLADTNVNINGLHLRPTADDKVNIIDNVNIKDNDNDGEGWSKTHNDKDTDNVSIFFPETIRCVI